MSDDSFDATGDHWEVHRAKDMAKVRLDFVAHELGIEEGLRRHYLSPEEARRLAEALLKAAEVGEE